MRYWPPISITNDKLPSYPEAIALLKREGQLSKYIKASHVEVPEQHHEADHGALKRVIRPTRGFQTMKTAAAKLKGFEIIRMIRRGHCLTCKQGVHNEIRFVNRLFQVAA